MDYLFNILTVICLPFIGWLIRKLFSLEESIVQLKANMVSRNELSEVINTKQEAIKVLQQEQKEDILRLESKLDRVLELMSGGKSSGK